MPLQRAPLITEDHFGATLNCIASHFIYKCTTYSQSTSTQTSVQMHQIANRRVPLSIKTAAPLLMHNLNAGSAGALVKNCLNLSQRAKLGEHFTRWPGRFLFEAKSDHDKIIFLLLNSWFKFWNPKRGHLRWRRTSAYSQSLLDILLRQKSGIFPLVWQVERTLRGT